MSPIIHSKYKRDASITIFELRKEQKLHDKSNHSFKRETLQSKIIFLGNSNVDDPPNWRDGKWVLLAILLFMVVGALVGTFVVNKLRIDRGDRPIRGTSWLSPPSYEQSQDTYTNNGNSGIIGDEPLEGNFVPEYTQQPNENIDLGYYDERGDFHLSKKEDYEYSEVPIVASQNSETDEQNRDPNNNETNPINENQDQLIDNIANISQPKPVVTTDSGKKNNRIALQRLSESTDLLDPNTNISDNTHNASTGSSSDFMAVDLETEKKEDKDK